MRKPVRIISGLLLAASALSAAAQAQALDVEQQIETALAAPKHSFDTVSGGVVVRGRPDPLRRSDRRLAVLIGALPLTADEHPSAQPGLADRLKSEVAQHRDPNQAGGEERHMMQRVSATPEVFERDPVDADWMQ